MTLRSSASQKIMGLVGIAIWVLGLSTITISLEEEGVISTVLWVVSATGFGCIGLYALLGRVTLEEGGVSLVSFPRWRFFAWESVESVEIKPQRAMVPRPVVAIRVRGRRRAVELWPTSMSKPGAREAMVAQIEWYIGREAWLREQSRGAGAGA